MADINLGDNYEIDEDSNGNLVIKDNSNNIVLQHDHANSEWSVGDSPLTNVASVGDASQGDIYDGANLVADVDNQSVRTEDLYNDQLPDVVVKRDGADAVAMDMAGGTEISRHDAISGRGSYVVLQDAVDHLGSDGGRIHVVSGYYSADSFTTFNNEPPLLLVNKDHVTISGDGASTLLTIENGATASDEGARIIHVTGSANDGSKTVKDFTLRNLKIDGNQQNNGGEGDGNTIGVAIDGHNVQIQARDWEMVNVRSINSTGDGVEPISRTTESDGDPQCKDGVVEGCIFRDSWEQNVHIHGARGLEIDGNICDGEHQNGNISLYSEETDVVDCEITNNIIINGDKAGAQLRTNVDTTQARGILFEGNIVANNTRGVTTRGDDLAQSNADGIDIKNNIIRSNDEVGIIAIGTDINIKNNTIKLNGWEGIFGVNRQQEVTIADNKVLNNNQAPASKAGIKIECNDSTATLRNVVVRDNDVVSVGDPDHYRGIFFSDATTGSYTDIRCFNNTIKRVNQPDQQVIDNGIGALIRDNNNNDDYVSSPPSSIPKTAGVWYYDDGTNTGSGTRGKRVYDGSTFVDAWTL